MSLVTETGLPSLGHLLPFMRTQYFRVPKRDPAQQNFEVFAATRVLDRNSQVRYHKCMAAVGVRKTSRALRSAQTVDPITGSA